MSLKTQSKKFCAPRGIRIHSSMVRSTKDSSWLRIWGRHCRDLNIPELELCNSQVTHPAQFPLQSQRQGQILSRIFIFVNTNIDFKVDRRLDGRSVSVVRVCSVNSGIKFYVSRSLTARCLIGTFRTKCLYDRTDRGSLWWHYVTNVIVGKGKHLNSDRQCGWKENLTLLVASAIILLFCNFENEIGV
jgi:hypothetical protein